MHRHSHHHHRHTTTQPPPVVCRMRRNTRRGDCKGPDQADQDQADQTKTKPTKPTKTKPTKPRPSRSSQRPNAQANAQAPKRPSQHTPPPTHLYHIPINIHSTRLHAQQCIMGHPAIYRQNTHPQVTRRSDGHASFIRRKLRSKT